MKLSGIGEFGIIDLIKHNLVKNPGEVVMGVGDDAAVLKNPGRDTFLFAADMLVEDVHFSLSFGTHFDVGFKAVSVNASDIAAMGGTPTHAVVSVALPEETKVSDVTSLYDGIRQAAALYGVNIVGGDTVAIRKNLVINIAMLGICHTNRPVLRSGARPGDVVCVTGSLGASAAGLHVKKNPGCKWPASCMGFVERAYLTPRARVEEGRLLAETEGVTAMIDISDGLAGDMAQICRSSGVGCVIRAENIPVARETMEISKAAGIDYLEWVLYGGEDFELLFTIKPDSVKAAEEAFKTAGYDFQQIGIIEPAARGILLHKPGNIKEKIRNKGYNHFMERMEV